MTTVNVTACNCYQTHSNGILGTIDIKVKKDQLFISKTILGYLLSWKHAVAMTTIHEATCNCYQTHLNCKLVILDIQVKSGTIIYFKTNFGVLVVMETCSCYENNTFVLLSKNNQGFKNWERLSNVLKSNIK